MSDIEEDSPVRPHVIFIINDDVLTKNSHFFFVSHQNQLLCICYGLVVNREFYKMDYKLDPMIEAVSFHVDSPYFENDIL